MSELMDTIRLVLLMIVGTVIGGILCFLNGLFKKPYLYFRNILFLLFIGFFISLQIGFAIRRSPHYYRWFVTAIELIIPIVFASASIFLGMLEPRLHELISMVLTGPLVFCILRIATATNLSTAVLVGVGLSVVLFATALMFTKQYFCFECSLCGGYVIASLYTDCFYLSNLVFFIIFGLLTIGGTVFGIFLKEKVTDKINGKSSKA